MLKTLILIAALSMPLLAHAESSFPSGSATMPTSLSRDQLPPPRPTYVVARFQLTHAIANARRAGLPINVQYAGRHVTVSRGQYILNDPRVIGYTIGRTFYRVRACAGCAVHYRAGVPAAATTSPRGYPTMSVNGTVMEQRSDGSWTIQ